MDLPVSQAQFDSAYYFDRNPDVKAAGWDAWNHYATFGANEGRSWRNSVTGETGQGGAHGNSHQDNINFITGLYSTYYHRAPDTAGLNFWVGELENGSQTIASAPHVFATSPDISPNAGQTLQAYLTALGIAPFAGYTFSADGGSIVPVSTSTSIGTNTDPGTTTPVTIAPSTIPVIGPIIDGLGGVAIGLPLVGPYISSWSQSSGISPGWLAVGAVLIGAWALGAFEDGGGHRKS